MSEIIDFSELPYDVSEIVDEHLRHGEFRSARELGTSALACLKAHGTFSAGEYYIQGTLHFDEEADS